MSIYVLFTYCDCCKLNNIDPTAKGLFIYKKNNWR